MTLCRCITRNSRYPRAAGATVIDGHLNDPGWRNTARAGNFAEHSPGDQTRPDVDTEVMITYDDSNLYIGVDLL